MILEVRRLRILTAIADHGTVSAATKHVYLTQSAISKALGRLRRQFNDPLFHRASKGLVPTPFALRLRTSSGASPLCIAISVMKRAPCAGT